MLEIVLTEEQARVLDGATTTVVVRNLSGAAVGTIDPQDAAIIAEAKRRLATERGQGTPNETVLARLTALQAEWDRTGGFDHAHMTAFLAQLRAAGR